VSFLLASEMRRFFVSDGGLCFVGSFPAFFFFFRHCRLKLEYRRGAATSCLSSGLGFRFSFSLQLTPTFPRNDYLPNPGFCAATAILHFFFFFPLIFAAIHRDSHWSNPPLFTRDYPRSFTCNTSAALTYGSSSGSFRDFKVGIWFDLLFYC